MNNFILITADFECQQLLEDYYDSEDEFVKYSGLCNKDAKELLDTGCLDNWSRKYILIQTP